MKKGIITENNNERIKEALLLIDIQDIYFTPGPMLLHKPRCAAKNAARVLEKFRAEGKAVIHVQHNFKVLAGIHSLVKPIEGEKIVHKEYPSSFLGTDLRYESGHGTSQSLPGHPCRARMSQSGNNPSAR